METNNKYPFVNLPLPYAYNALEPYIDEKTMMLHHDKHLQTYIDNLNTVLHNQPKYQEWTLEELLYNAARLPADIQTAVINNGGGVYNHRLYFDGLINGGTKIGPKTSQLIDKSFGSMDKFKEQLKVMGLGVFGSGYAWLGFNKAGELKLIKTANQDTPIPLNLYPILNLDVWEHAYYLKHYNVRTDYIDDYLNIINWDRVEERITEFEKKNRKV
ncbi:MAG: superoxide dismutase [Christensenellaceae bacterium]|jgi:Fe-Mn family superoxide dismutase|nr:superoxide dismutase [Christensenellaceae bacterium]